MSRTTLKEGYSRTPVTMLEPDDAHVSLVFIDYETSTRISGSGLRISTSIGWTCTMLRRRLHLFLFLCHLRSYLIHSSEICYQSLRLRLQVRE